MAMTCSPKHPGCTPAHWQCVTDYRAAREAFVRAREDAVGLYGPGSPEWAEWAAQNDGITLKVWLVQMTGTYRMYGSNDEDGTYVLG